MPSSTTPTLVLEDVRKTFGPVVALRSGSLTVHPGSIHALVGENGAGKSTLVKIVAGVYRRDAGSFLLDGEEADFHSTADSKAAGVAVIYQEPTLFPDLSVTENIFMGRQPLRAGRRIDRAAMHAEAARLFRGLGVRIDPRRPAAGLSIADQQIIEIAKAISLDARLLIMDEPTAALSGVEVDRLFAVARGLRDEGRALVFISHRFDEVFSLCDTVTVMRDGAYVSSQSIDEHERRPARGGRWSAGRSATCSRRRPPRSASRSSRWRALRLHRHVQRRRLHGSGRRDRRPGRSGRRGPQRDRSRSVRGRRVRRGLRAGQGTSPAEGQSTGGDPRRSGLHPRGPAQAGAGDGQLGDPQRRRGDPHAAGQGGADHRGRGDPSGGTLGRPPRGEDQCAGHERRHDERRQPAEGRDRQVAGHQALAADHRRADPRHRRRDEGGGPPPAVRAGRTGPRRS